MKNNEKEDNRIKSIIRKSALISSFKIGKRFWSVLLLNTIFIILVLALISSYTFMLRSNMDKIKPLNASTTRIQQMTEGNVEPSALLMQDLQIVSSALHLFFINMTLISITSFIMLIAITGYFKTVIWSKITEEKFDKYTAIKLSILLLIWNLLWILISLFSVFGLKFEVNTLKIITIIELVLYIYFSLLIIPIFFRIKKIFKSIRKTFSIGALRIYAISPSLLAMLVAFLIILSLIINLAYGLNKAWGIAEIPLILLYVVWIKFYMNAVIGKVYYLV